MLLKRFANDERGFIAKVADFGLSRCTDAPLYVYVLFLVLILCERQ